jgi:hypothetical protein
MTSAAFLCTSRRTVGFQQLSCALLMSLALNTQFVLAQPFRMRAAPPSVPSLDFRRAFESRIDEQASFLASDRRLRHLSQRARRDAVEFMVGNVLIGALHQLGLALVSEFRLPALGGSDQAADDFAILTALELGKTHFSDRILMEAAKSSLTGKRRKKTAIDTLRSLDETGLNQRRANRMVCLTAGSDAVRFKALIEDTALPRNLGRNCGWDYDNALRSWEIVLRPYRPRADQPKTEVDVSYGAADGNLRVYEQVFRNLGFLETLAEVTASQITWRAPLRLEMRSCGVAAATWSAATRTLSVCYEMAGSLAERYLERKRR